MARGWDEIQWHSWQPLLLKSHTSGPCHGDLKCMHQMTLWGLYAQHACAWYDGGWTKAFVSLWVTLRQLRLDWLSWRRQKNIITLLKKDSRLFSESRQHRHQMLLTLIKLEAAMLSGSDPCQDAPLLPCSQSRCFNKKLTLNLNLSHY